MLFNIYEIFYYMYNIFRYIIVKVVILSFNIGKDFVLFRSCILDFFGMELWRE